MSFPCLFVRYLQLRIFVVSIFGLDQRGFPNGEEGSFRRHLDRPPSLESSRRATDWCFPTPTYAQQECSVCGDPLLEGSQAGRCVLGTLVYLHNEKGIAHRDLKPGQPTPLPHPTLLPFLWPRSKGRPPPRVKSIFILEFAEALEGHVMIIWGELLQISSCKESIKDPPTPSLFFRPSSYRRERGCTTKQRKYVTHNLNKPPWLLFGQSHVPLTGQFVSLSCVGSPDFGLLYLRLRYFGLSILYPFRG